MRKVALVTGGSRGIGLGVATALAASGYDLAINGRRPAAEVEPALADLRAAGVDAIYCPADVAALADHGPMLAAVRDRFGRLDVLVQQRRRRPHCPGRRARRHGGQF